MNPFYTPIDMTSALHHQMIAMGQGMLLMILVSKEDLRQFAMV